MIHAICVAGARPNLIKIKPVIDGLESLGAKTTFVHTGQHYDEAMSGVFLDDLGLRQPDRSLGVGSGTHAEQTARVMVTFMLIVEELCLDLAIVGLVNSTVDLIVRGQGRAQVVQIEAGDARLRPFSCWDDRHHRRVDNIDHGTRSVQRDRTDAYTCSRRRKRTLDA